MVGVAALVAGRLLGHLADLADAPARALRPVGSVDGHARRRPARAPGASRRGRRSRAAPSRTGRPASRPGARGVADGRPARADPRRPAPEHDLALGRARRPPSSPCASWNRSTAAVVAASHSSSTSSVAVGIVAERAQVALELADVLAVVHPRRRSRARPAGARRAGRPPARRRARRATVPALTTAPGRTQRGDRARRAGDERAGPGIAERAVERRRGRPGRAARPSPWRPAAACAGGRRARVVAAAERRDPARRARRPRARRRRCDPPRSRLPPSHIMSPPHAFCGRLEVRVLRVRPCRARA